MIEIRVHGRGGQGAVTTGQILAIAAFNEGMQSQTFPMFGVERSGAPVQAFARIDNKPIHHRCQIYEPNIVLVLEPTLLKAIDVTKGMKPGSTLIINTTQDPSEIKVPNGVELHCIDATSIALNIFGKPVVNTAILGAYAAITKRIKLESLKNAIDERFIQTKGKKVADLNKKAIEEVYKNTK